MLRCSALLLLILTSVSCSAQPVSEPRASTQPGGPALDGKDYLLSEADFRAVLAVVRNELARTHPWLRVRRVHVITRDRVEVYVRDPTTAEYTEHGDIHSVELQRSKNGWR